MRARRDAVARSHDGLTVSVLVYNVPSHPRAEFVRSTRHAPAILSSVVVLGLARLGRNGAAADEGPCYGGVRVQCVGGGSACCDSGNWCSMDDEFMYCHEGSPPSTGTATSGGCPPHSSPGPDGECLCDAGYEVNVAATGCEQCDDSCSYANNGYCEDGGPASSTFGLCSLGTDCTDCGGGGSSGGGSSGGGCPPHSSPSRDGRCACDKPYAPNAAGTGCECDDTCNYGIASANNGYCEDGSDPNNPSYIGCDPGTDCTDCGGCATPSVGTPVLDWTGTVQVQHRQYIEFEAVSGKTYDVTVQPGAKSSGRSMPCTSDGYDTCQSCVFGQKSCSDIISDGVHTCEQDFCPDCVPYKHLCDATCGIDCVEDGVAQVNLRVLPPGATQDVQAVASNDNVGRCKKLSFNAAATGTFKASVYVQIGSGPVVLNVVEVGEAVETSPPLQADGEPHSLSISCRSLSCHYHGDSDFVLDAEAGRAYAFLVELKDVTQPAVQVKATFYQAGAAAGAAGFAPVVSGPMGKWTATQPGHESWAEHFSCTTSASTADGRCSNIPASFGIYPGGDEFPRLLTGTWVAPASGAVLLQLTMNCDVPFWADVQLSGCDADNYHGVPGQYGCDDPNAGFIESDINENNGMCESELLLTVTPGAYFDRSLAVATEPSLGLAKQTDTIVVSKAEIERQAAATWESSHGAGRRLQMDGEGRHPPSLDDMLVPGSPANQILVDLFTAQQQPSVIYPVSFAQGDVDGGRRQLQHQADRLIIEMETHAPTPMDANAAQQRLEVRVSPHGIGSCDLVSRTNAVNVECCDEPTEDCSSGIPTSCNIGCARVVLPFFEDCSTALGKHASDFDDVVALCRAELSPSASQGGRRRVQSDGGCGGGGCHAKQICGLGSTAKECTESGQTTQSSQIVLPRTDVEAILREQFDATLDEALVSGTEANARLASIFTHMQAPLDIEPTLFNAGEFGGGHRRQMQHGGDQLHVTIDTHAATASDAASGVEELAARLHGTVVGQ